MSSFLQHPKHRAHRENVYVPRYKSDEIFFACALLLLLFSFERINVVQERCVGECVHVCGELLSVCVAMPTSCLLQFLL